MLGYLMMFGWPGIGALVFGGMFLWKTIKQSRVASGIAALACIGLCVSAFWPTSGNQQAMENAAGKQAKKTRVSGNRNKRRPTVMPPMPVARHNMSGSQPIPNAFPGAGSVLATGARGGISATNGLGNGPSNGSHTTASQPQGSFASRSVAVGSARVVAPSASRASIQINAPHAAAKTITTSVPATSNMPVLANPKPKAAQANPAASPWPASAVTPKPSPVPATKPTPTAKPKTATSPWAKAAPAHERPTEFYGNRQQRERARARQAARDTSSGVISGVGPHATGSDPWRNSSMHNQYATQNRVAHQPRNAPASPYGDEPSILAPFAFGLQHHFAPAPPPGYQRHWIGGHLMRR